MLGGPTYQAPRTGFAAQGRNMPRSTPVTGAPNPTSAPPPTMQPNAVPGTNNPTSPQPAVGTPAFTQRYGTPGQGNLQPMPPSAGGGFFGASPIYTQQNLQTFEDLYRGTPINQAPAGNGGANLLAESLFGGPVDQDYERWIADHLAGLPADQRNATIAALQENLPSFQSALPAAFADLGVQQSQVDLDRERQWQQMGYGVQDYGFALGDLGQNYQNSMDALNLQRQALGIQRQGYGQDIDYYNQMIGLAGQQYGNQLAGFDLSDTTSERERRERDRGLRSDAASRGAFISQGFRDDMTNSADMLAEQLQGSQIGREGARIGRDQSVAGYNRGINQARQGLAQAGITAQQFGLSERQFEQALQRGMRNAGIDLQRGTDAIMNNLADLDITSLGNTQAAISTLLEYSGVFDNMGN